MNSGNINVKNMEILNVTKCEYKKSINDFGNAVIEGYIDETHYEMCKHKAYSGEWFAIEEKIDSDTKIVFSGIVKSVEFYCNRGYRIKLVLQGKIANMDVALKNRIFQNNVNALDDIIEKVCETYNAQYIVSSNHISNISHLVVQYEETDWNFLKRIIIESGGCLIPEYSNNECRFMTGIIENREICIDTEEYAINSLYYEYENKIQNGLDVYIDDQFEYVIKERRIFNIGDSINLNGKLLYVYHAEGKWEGQELIHYYTLRSKNAFKQINSENYRYIGASFPATVSKVKHDKIEVSFDSVEAYGIREYNYATVYSSANGSGWYCMPEVGDTVSITFATQEPESVYASGAVHLSMGQKDADTKFIRNPYNKEIRFTKDELLITNNQGTELILNDANGLTLKSATEINITAQKGITISSETDKIILQAENGVELKQGKSKIAVNGNITLEGDQVHIQNVE